MHYAPASLFLLFTYLLIFARAGQDDRFGIFLPKDLSADLETRAAASLSSRADSDSPIKVTCRVHYSEDRTIVPPPDMVRLVRVWIRGLADADDHADTFKQAVDEACFAGNIKSYEPHPNMGKNEMAVDIKVHDTIELDKQDAAPLFCHDDAIKKFTGITDLPPCPNTGL